MHGQHGAVPFDWLVEGVAPVIGHSEMFDELAGESEATNQRAGSRRKLAETLRGKEEKMSILVFILHSPCNDIGKGRRAAQLPLGNVCRGSWMTGQEDLVDPNGTITSCARLAGMMRSCLAL